MSKNKKIFPILIGILILPIAVFAEEKIVNCGGLDCSFCSLIETLSSTSRWIFSIVAVSAVFVLVLSGFFYIFSLGKEKDIKKAKKIARNSLYGFFFVLIAFLLISTFIWLIGGKREGGFFVFSCDENTNKAKKDLAESTFSPWEEIEKTANLNSLDSKELEAILLDLKGTNAENLRQDLLTQRLNTNLKLIGLSEDLSYEDIANYIKMTNGYKDGLSGVDQKNQEEYLESLREKIQEIANIERWEADLKIQGEKDFEKSSGIYPTEDREIPKRLNNLLNEIEDKKIDNVLVYKNAKSSENISACVDSGGSWEEFQNQCQAQNPDSNSCSDVYNPTMGCRCQPGATFFNNRCLKKSVYEEETSVNKDSDRDGIANKVDQCPGTPEDETPDKNSKSDNFGCSCSQIAVYERTCPATRCEGDYLVTYPPSGKDSCFSGLVSEHSCEKINSEKNETCGEISPILNPEEKEREAKKDKETYDQIKDSLDREKSDGSFDQWNQKGSGSTGNDRTDGSTSGTGETGPDGKIPPDKGPGTFNPSANFEEMAKCIGFKDGKVPYNGVLVLLLNKDDPTNANHPDRNASRLFYLTREGQVVGSNGDKGTEQGGLLAGPWTKGSGGTVWSPGFSFFNAQTVHVNGSPDPCSFKSGQGAACGPQGEGKLSNGQIGGEKMQGMSGCNMHSGSKRSHSRGCLTMGGRERCGFTNTVKSMATQNQGKIMMATLTAENADKNIVHIKSEYCGKMDPYKAIKKYQEQKDRSFDPFSGYNSK